MVLMIDIDIDLGLLLHDATRMLRRRFDRRVAALGLSSAQWRLLVHTLREGRVRQARLAERLEIEPISVSRLVDRMEQAGWVARQADPTDRRIKVIVPTEQALAACEGIRAMAREVIGEALLGMDRPEREKLGAALSTLATNLANAETAELGCCGSEDMR